MSEEERGFDLCHSIGMEFGLTLMEDEVYESIRKERIEKESRIDKDEGKEVKETLHELEMQDEDEGEEFLEGYEEFDEDLSWDNEKENDFDQLFNECLSTTDEKRMSDREEEDCSSEGLERLDYGKRPEQPSSFKENGDKESEEVNFDWIDKNLNVNHGRDSLIINIIFVNLRRLLALIINYYKVRKMRELIFVLILSLTIGGAIARDVVGPKNFTSCTTGTGCSAKFVTTATWKQGMNTEEIKGPNKDIFRMTVDVSTSYTELNLGTWYLSAIPSYAVYSNAGCGPSVIQGSSCGSVNPQAIGSEPWRGSLSGWNYRGCNGPVYLCYGISITPMTLVAVIPDAKQLTTALEVFVGGSKTVKKIERSKQATIAKADVQASNGISVTSDITITLKSINHENIDSISNSCLIIDASLNVYAVPKSQCNPAGVYSPANYGVVQSSASAASVFGDNSNWVEVGAIDGNFVSTNLKVQPALLNGVPSIPDVRISMGNGGKLFTPIDLTKECLTFKSGSDFAYGTIAACTNGATVSIVSLKGTDTLTLSATGSSLANYQATFFTPAALTTMKLALISGVLYVVQTEGLALAVMNRAATFSVEVAMEMGPFFAGNELTAGSPIIGSVVYWGNKTFAVQLSVAASTAKCALTMGNNSLISTYAVSTTPITVTYYAQVLPTTIVFFCLTEQNETSFPSNTTWTDWTGTQEIIPANIYEVWLAMNCKLTCLAVVVDNTRVLRWHEIIAILLELLLCFLLWYTPDSNLDLWRSVLFYNWPVPWWYRVTPNGVDEKGDKEWRMRRYAADSKEFRALIWIYIMWGILSWLIPYIMVFCFVGNQLYCIVKRPDFNLYHWLNRDNKIVDAAEYIPLVDLKKN